MSTKSKKDKEQRQLFNELFKKNYNQVVCRLMRIFQMREEIAEDIAIRSFTKVFMGFHKFDKKFAFSTYINFVAKNQALDYLRVKRDNQNHLEINENYRFKTEDPFEAYERKEIMSLIDKALVSISPDKAYAFKQHYFYNQSYEQIALKNKTNINNVKTNIHRAKKEIKAFLNACNIFENNHNDLCHV